MSPRCLLIGPPGSGKTSLLFQHAFNRARRGLSTLYVACGPRDSLTVRPPARPRLGEAAAATPASAGSSSTDEEEARALPGEKRSRPKTALQMYLNHVVHFYGMSLVRE